MIGQLTVWLRFPQSTDHGPFGIVMGRLKKVIKDQAQAR